jgi:glycosyltransferase involved in cell wall biosynthesis
VVADGLGNDLSGEIKIWDVGKSKSRIRRILFTRKTVYKQARKIDADVYHFHDPELMIYGVRLKKKGKEVIYDIHEDLPRQIFSKPYIPKFLANAVSTLLENYENVKAKEISYLITPTDHIKDRFSQVNANTTAIKNFPKFEEFEMKENLNKDIDVCYIGALTRIRGIAEIIKAAGIAGVNLHIAGTFNDSKLEKEVKEMPEWKYVTYHGYIPREEIKELLARSKAGLVTLYPITNYKVALAIKMFEYMIAGIPVIASDFPLWRKIVEENQCGMCVNPMDPKSIAWAIQYIINHPKEADIMGRNGYEAVKNRYNWSVEGEKLKGVYKMLTDE